MTSTGKGGRWDALGPFPSVSGSPGRVEAMLAPGESAAPSAAGGPERQDWELNVDFRAWMLTADRAVNHTNIRLKLLSAAAPELLSEQQRALLVRREKHKLQCKSALLK